MNIIQWISYKIYNIKYNIKFNIKSNNADSNICILLAAGTSTRFDNKQSKQLAIINDKPVILYSINALINVVNKIIIVTNTQCYNEIIEIIKNLNNNKIIVLINDINLRNISIKTGLVYINQNYNNINNIIIQDSARPFVTEDHYKNLLKSNETFQYSQYYLKLLNGLAKKENTRYEIYDRNQFIEICTPVCCNYNLIYFIYMNYICNNNPFTEEPITILNLMNIKYNCIEGFYKHLRKITYINDI